MRFRRSPLGRRWINGGFFVLSPPYSTTLLAMHVWEQERSSACTRRSAGAYRHEGFWQPMDTLRDKRQLEELWRTGRAPWKTW